MINNRPDGEALFGQPSAAKVGAAAEAAGIAGAACGGRPLDELLRLAAAAGQDLSGQRPLIDRLVAETSTAR